MEMSGQYIKLVNPMKKSPGTNLLGAWVKPGDGLEVLGQNESSYLLGNRTQTPQTSSSDPSHHMDWTSPTPIMGLEGDAG